VPGVGAVEGEQGYECTYDGDCHLIVIDTSTCRLHEMWRANVTADEFFGGCQAVWDLTETYSPELRGECCTSADAAGLPIAAHMFSADDIAKGEINHAIRFIMPNDFIRERIYVHPATHATPATSGPDDAPPYGARMRLRADFDDSSLNDAAKVVARALQKYGMILSDGGNITFTAMNDRFTEHKWTDVGLMPNDLTSLEWSDFEMVDGGERLSWDDNCNCDRAQVETK
jgi:serine/threonine-protein kinase